MTPPPSEPSTAEKRHHVVIIGSGFGGLNAAKALKRANVDITLISKTTTHLFQPLLYQVATGILSEGDIAPTTRLILRNQKNVRVLLGEVSGDRPGIPDGHLEADQHGDGDALRQLDRGRGRSAVLLRQRSFRHLRARHEDHRRRTGAAWPHPRRVRGRRSHHRPCRARTSTHLRRRRGRTHRRRTRRRDRATRRTHPGRGVPDHHAQRVPGDSARRRAGGIAADGPEAGRQSATETGKDGCRGPAQRDGDRGRLQGHHRQGEGRQRTPHRVRVQGVGGRSPGQLAGQDHRRAVRRNRNRPRRTGCRGARPHRQGPPERLRRRRSDVGTRRARDGPGRDPGCEVRHQCDQARRQGQGRPGRPRAVPVPQQGQHGPHLSLQRRRAGRQGRVRRLHRLVGVAGAAPDLPGRTPEPDRRHVLLGTRLPGPHPGSDGHHQSDDLRAGGGEHG